MEVVGALGAIIGIVDVATRSIMTLASIRRRLKGVNLSVELLHGQLTTVRTALQQIQLLVNESLQDQQHYQLTMNLDVSIKCCHLLLTVLDEHISKLEPDKENNIINFESKIKVVLESRGIDECLERLNRQIVALNLVITAFRARDLSSQKKLIEDEASQQVFERVRDDSSSLLVLCDAASFVAKQTSTTTATSSALSRKFSFDSELLQHRTYKNTYRSLLRRVKTNAIDRGSQDNSSGLAPSSRSTEAELNAKNSKIIDARLKADRAQQRREIKILVIGEHTQLIVRNLQMIERSESSADKRQEFRYDIYRYLLLTAQAASQELCIDYGLEHEERQEHEATLAAAKIDDSSIPLKPELRRALRLSAEAMKRLPELEDPLPYFLGDIDRILSDSYIPTEMDIFSLPLPSGIQETPIKTGPVNYRLTYSSSPPSKKIDHAFESVYTTILTVNLACYDFTSLRGNSEIEELWMQFELLMSSPWYRDTSFLILLFNEDLFHAKLENTPLETIFPDYADDKDYGKAVEYIIKKFLAMNQSINRSIYWYSLNRSLHGAHIDYNLHRVFEDVVRETILDKHRKRYMIST